MENRTRLTAWQGVIVAAVIVVVVTVVFTAIGAAADRRRRASHCMTNLSTLAMAYMVYCDEYTRPHAVFRAGESLEDLEQTGLPDIRHKSRPSEFDPTISTSTNNLG